MDWRSGSHFLVLLVLFSAHESTLRKPFRGEHILNCQWTYSPNGRHWAHICNSILTSEYVSTHSHPSVHLCEWPSVLAKAVYKDAWWEPMKILCGPLHRGQNWTKKALRAPDENILQEVSLQNIVAALPGCKCWRRKEKGGVKMPEKTHISVSLWELIHTCNVDHKL